MGEVKVEIRIVDGGWQWLGKMSENNLKALTEIANILSDIEENS